jgi:PTS system mannose-specific IIA component
MFGIVVAAHDELGPALVRAAEGMVGRAPNVATVRVLPQDGVERIQAALRAAVEEARDGDGVLVLCDLYGGSPSSACLSMRWELPIEVLTGVNLPMLVKALTLRDRPLAEVAPLLVTYGQRHVTHASRLCRPVVEEA